MRIRDTRPTVVQVTMTRAELSILMAAARMAHDVLLHDPRAPQAGRDALAAVLRGYDAARDRRATDPATTRAPVSPGPS